jgi:hypothetical protein
MRQWAKKSILRVSKARSSIPLSRMRRNTKIFQYLVVKVFNLMIELSLGQDKKVKVKIIHINEV